MTESLKAKGKYAVDSTKDAAHKLGVKAGLVKEDVTRPEVDYVSPSKTGLHSTTTTGGLPTAASLDPNLPSSQRGVVPNMAGGATTIH